MNKGYSNCGLYLSFHFCSMVSSLQSHTICVCECDILFVFCFSFITIIIILFLASLDGIGAQDVDLRVPPVGMTNGPNEANKRPADEPARDETKGKKSKSKIDM